ncbi:MAG: ATP-binding protein [Bacillota bacterium]|nr:ATP-binding protein [Bacillota bacterium]
MPEGKAERAQSKGGERFALSLRVKVTLAMVVLVFFTAATIGGLVHSALNRQFARYVRVNEERRNQRIVEVLAAAYQLYGGWERVGWQLSHLGLSTDTWIRVLDNWGRVVYDSNASCSMSGMGGMMMRRWGRMRSPAEGPPFGPPVQEPPEMGPVAVLPIQVEGEKVGTAYIASTGRRGLYSQQDLLFRRTFDRSVLLAGLLGGAGALLLGLVLSRRITEPLLHLNQAARRLAEGDLSQRVPVETGDEVGRLAQTFNFMAARLEELEKLRRKLTADVAHELRTPLTAIRSYIEAFQDGVLKPEGKHLEDLHQEVLRLVRMVEDLRELSLAEAREKRLHLEPLELGDLAAAVADRLRPLMEEKGIALEVTPGPALTVRGDAEALNRVLHNLLFNAYQYTESGGRVRVTVERRGGMAAVDVSDTGIGIAPQDLPYIFERFYRADPSRTRATGGTGIGLTIARELVQAHGGRIEVKSEPGRGSTFTVLLPLAPSS